jgi:predicted ATPase
MIRLRIKNFGPIKTGLIENDGWIDFSRVTIFVGNQGSGKSSIAKLFSTFSWIEKALVRGDYEKKWFERKNRLRNQFLNYHRLDNYFDPKGSNTTEIEYQGEAFSMKYTQGQLVISENKTDAYHLPQVMYVPAERNFIAYVRNARELKLSSDSLKEFLTEFDNAKLNMKGVVHLPINGVELEYDKLNDLINIRDKNYRLRLTDASSGFQSLVPLFLVSQNLAKTVKAQSEDNARPMSADEVDRFKRGVENIFNNKTLTEEQQRVALSVLSARFNKTAFINIVEEPEQNLFPDSQWEVLKCLLEFNNQTSHNRLIITTHSPYIINFMSIAVQGMNLMKKIQSIQPPNRTLLTRLEAIISREALVAAEDLSIYQLDELTGSIVKLPTFEGIPTDRNFLNDTLRKGNAQFDELLAIEEELQA